MERSRNVAPTLPRCQPRLRHRCAATLEQLAAHRNPPQTRKIPCKLRTLIVTTFALASARQRHRHQGGPLALDVWRKAQDGHAARHGRGHLPPPVILERVDDMLGLSARQCIGGPHRSHERREELAPGARHCAPARIEGMSASVAAGTRQLARTKPAGTADEPGLQHRPWGAADGADGRKQEVEQRRASRAGAEGYESAFHITDRSGSIPNHRSNAMAPCSMSMPSPSDARCPARRAALTQSVSPCA